MVVLRSHLGSLMMRLSNWFRVEGLAAQRCAEYEEVLWVSEPLIMNL